jgi:hypothetical protein
VGQRHDDTGLFDDVFVAFFCATGGGVLTTAVVFLGALTVAAFALEELVDLRVCAGGF